MSTIRPTGFYVLRKPLLPVNTLIRWLDHTTTKEGLEPALRTLYRRSDLQEAIYHASPQLYLRLGSWLQTPDFTRNELARKK